MQNNNNNPFSVGNNNMNKFNTMSQSEVGSVEQIDSKTLSIIEDQANHEAIAYKKCTVYANYFQDKSLQEMAQCQAQHHREHFDALQNYLNSHRQ